MNNPGIYLENLDAGYTHVLKEGLAWHDAGSRIRRDTTVFIKPNLTFPVFRKGVMTNPECVEALIIALKDYTDRIIVGESDSGGYNRFDMDDVQEKIGLKAVAKRYGVRIVNLSHLPRGTIVVPTPRKRLEVPFPELLLGEADLVVSAAVPKIHMNTLVSMTVKNLWGCIPEPKDRLKLHPYLPYVLFAIVKRLRSFIGVIDGQYGLNVSGPMSGEPVKLDWLMMSDSLYGADAACCELMQVPTRKVRFLKLAEKRGEAMPGLEACRRNGPWKPFRKEAFYLKRAWTDIPGQIAFHSPFISYLAYFSPLAGILHRILYWFRKPFYDYDSPDKTER